MIQDIVSQIRTDMKKALQHLEEQVTTIRTGRAQAALVEGIMVSYYGATTPLKQIATIQVPDATSILIQPWDPKAVPDIEQAIRESDLGLQPSNDGRHVRLSIPPLTLERRTELVKILHRIGEEARMTLRSIRKAAWDEVQNQFQKKEITEDDKYQAEHDLNKIIDDFNSQIETIIKQKEIDITTV